MRTIFKAPLLKQGSRRPVVEDVQSRLNVLQDDKLDLSGSRVRHAA